MATKSKIRCPQHLGKHGRNLYRQVAEEYSITDPAGLALLSTAAECLDRMKQAQAVIEREGVTSPDRYGGTRVHPCCTLERDARNGMLSSLRALNLDIEPLRDSPGRPPGGTG